VFTPRLETAGVRIGTDDSGRALDNVFLERLRYSIAHILVLELEKGLHKYFAFYNHERPHQSLSYLG
jgi:putative transposase